MKSFIILCGFLSLAMGVTAQSKTISIKVAGNCEMCKSKIEKTALGKGAVKADWDTDTQLLTLIVDEKTSSIEIEKAIAAAGYDTEHIQGDATAYNNLPHCCQYERTADYDHAKAGCCKTDGDSATCCKHNDKSASCCAPKADGSKADCCIEGKTCCGADMDHASCCSSEHTCVKSADTDHCCGKDAKCITSGCCKEDMSCCAGVKVGDTCCTGGKCNHNN